jgi:hypothetical protein
MEIKELIERKSELIALKKAEIKTVKGGLSALIQSNVTKGVHENGENSLKRTIIGNTYNWMDSHDDVHAKGVFTKTIKERGNQIFHLHDHEFKLTSKIGEPLKVYEDMVAWKDLGVDKAGETQALFMDSEILKSYNERIFTEYKNGKINQHSVGMQYVKIDLAVKDEEYEEEHKIWLDNIDQIGNRELAEQKGYFWLVREAKLVEISAVLMGSNTLTPTINEPSKDTQKNEPPVGTQNEVEKLFNLINL